MTNRLENFSSPSGQPEDKHSTVDRSDPIGFQRTKDWVLSHEKLMDEALVKMDENGVEWKKTLDEFKRVSASFDKHFKEWEELVRRLSNEPDRLTFIRGKEIAGKYNELVNFLLVRREQLHDELNEFSIKAEKLQRDFYTTIAEMRGGIPELN